MLNWTYNSHIAPPIAVLLDEDGAIARRFGVTETPTTLVIDQHGTVDRRWDGFVIVADLDFAIRRLERRSPRSD